MGTVQPPDVDQHLTIDQLSDLLDGEATADVRGHIESCERCSAHVARLEEARDVVRDAPSMPPHLLDRAVAAGVAALSPSNVTPIADRRRSGPLPWIAGVAAALVGILGLAALVNSDSDRDDADTFATSAEEKSDVQEDSVSAPAADAEGGGAAAAGGGTSGGGAGSSGDLGEQSQAFGRSGAPPPEQSFTTEDELIAYLKESAEALSTTATSCSTEAAAALGVPIEQLRSEDVSWQDSLASLWVDPSQRRAVVMRPGGCSLVADLRY